MPVSTIFRAWFGVSSRLRGDCSPRVRQEMSESSRNVRIVRIYPLTVLFTFTMVIIINSILGLTSINVESHVSPLSSL